jgi:hypothetical protein
MLETKRPKDLHFTVEDGTDGSWPVFNGVYRRPWPSDSLADFSVLQLLTSEFVNRSAKRSAQKSSVPTSN